MLAAALLAAASVPAEGIRLSLTPYVSWNQGRLYYTTWGGMHSDDDSIRYRSKLDFPLNVNVAGLGIYIRDDHGWRGWPWRAELALATSLRERRSWAADSDWVYMPSSQGSSEAQLFSGVLNVPLPNYRQLTAVAMLEKPLNVNWRLSAGPWYRLLYTSYDLQGIYILNTTVSPIGVQTAKVFYEDVVVLRYRAICHLPGLRMGADYSRGPWRFSAAAVLMPWVVAYHRDDHVLRSLLGNATNQGRGLYLTAGLRVRLPGWLSGLSAGAQYERMDVRTKGHIDNHYYDDTPVPPYTVADSINVKQQAVTLYIDFVP